MLVLTGEKGIENFLNRLGNQDLCCSIPSGT
jgi:hypothetical protein